ncbi:MAG TPA: two-component regulator propeller domain-containing protein [Ignavibacteria bacterium]
MSLTALLLLIISSLSNSQSIPFRNYNKKDGLAHTGVYAITQDKTGFIWLGTQDGLSRFDGYTFVNYHNTDGLNENNFRGLEVSDDSTIYIATYSKGINIYKNYKFNNYSLNNFYDFYITGILFFNDTILASTTKDYKIIHNNTVAPVFNNSSSSDSNKVYKSYGYFFHTSENKLLFINKDGLYDIKNGQAEKINISGFSDSVIYGIAEDKNKNLWLGGFGKIYQLKDYQVIRTIELNNEIKGNIYNLFVDSNGDIWFYIQKKGLFCFINGVIVNIGEKIQLENHSVMCFYEDNQKNIWVGTLGKGVYCFYNDFIMNYNKSDGLSDNIINSICSLKDEGCLIATYNGLNLFKDRNFERIPTIKGDYSQDYISVIKNTFESSYTATLTGRKTDPLVIPRTYRDLQIYLMPGFGGCQLSSDEFVWGTSNNQLYSSDLSRRKIPDTVLIKGDSAYHNWVLDILPDADGSILVATEKGLVRIKGTQRRTFENDSVLSGFLSKIIKTGNNQYVAAGNNGIAILENDKVLHSFTEGQNFDFVKSLTVTVDDNRNLWIGTIRALYVVPLDSLLNNRTGSVKKLDESAGLPVGNINDVAYNKTSNCIYAGHDAGLSVIDLKRFGEFFTVPEKVSFTKLEFNDTVLYCNQNIELDYDHNDFILHFISFNYKSPNSISYEYKIENGQHWTETKTNKINFSSLAPGDYNLKIRAKDISGIRSETSVLNFKIHPPFWKTIPFYLGVSFLMLMLIAFIFFKRVQYIKKKAKENLEIQDNIASLKHQALASSLNPHFIFNTLNSIQHYINVHDAEQANEYLVNFARLIRMNLDLAGQTFISLETEIKRLELYLQYEQLRFEDKMNYKIDIGKDIDTERLLIPNMILQPFVENSIWHGLLPNDGKGLINISIKKEKKNINSNLRQVIILNITDDGVGLAESAKYKKSKHISKGVSIIKEKLDLLVPDIKDFKFIEIKDREDNITGTSVTITLVPGQYKIE